MNHSNFNGLIVRCTVVSNSTLKAAENGYTETNSNSAHSNSAHSNSTNSNSAHSNSEMDLSSKSQVSTEQILTWPLFEAVAIPNQISMLKTPLTLIFTSKFAVEFLLDQNPFIKDFLHQNRNNFSKNGTTDSIQLWAVGASTANSLEHKFNQELSFNSDVNLIINTPSDNQVGLSPVLESIVKKKMGQNSSLCIFTSQNGVSSTLLAHFLITNPKYFSSAQCVPLYKLTPKNEAPPISLKGEKRNICFEVNSGQVAEELLRRLKIDFSINSINNLPQNIYFNAVAKSASEKLTALGLPKRYLLEL